MMRYHLNIDRLGLKKNKNLIKTQNSNNYSPLFIITVSLPPPNVSLNFKRASTVFLMSLCSLLPKSLNIVDPPLNTQKHKNIFTKINRLTPTWQYYVVIQRPTNVDRTILDDVVYDLRQGHVEIGIWKFGVEEYFGPQKPTKIWLIKFNNNHFRAISYFS